MGGYPNRVYWTASIIAAGVMLALFLGGGPTPHPTDEPVSLSNRVDDSSTGALLVHVAGWVQNPGVFQLSSGAIVADAIEAAGGLRLGADTSSLNLALEVSDGEQVVVEGPGPQSSATESGPGGGGVISLNRASAQDLEQLPGVGPVLAERIVAHRETVGRFQSVDDLLDVPGIGEAKLATIRELVSP